MPTMDDRTAVYENGDSNHTGSAEMVNIYPLCCYYFGSTEPVTLRSETVADRLLRMKNNYESHGIRKCVAAVLVVELLKHPHILLLQVRNTMYLLPGGRLRQDESDVHCLRRKLSSKLCNGVEGHGPEWEVGECLGIWWKPDFETLVYPCLPPNVESPKECTKLFLIKLPASRRFIVPRNFRLLAVPLCQIRDNDRTYGPMISGLPQLLDRFSFNIVES